MGEVVAFVQTGMLAVASLSVVGYGIAAIGPGPVLQYPCASMGGWATGRGGGATGLCSVTAGFGDSLEVSTRSRMLAMAASAWSVGSL